MKTVFQVHIRVPIKPLLNIRVWVHIYIHTRTSLHHVLLEILTLQSNWIKLKWFVMSWPKQSYYNIIFLLVNYNQPWLKAHVRHSTSEVGYVGVGKVWAHLPTGKNSILPFIYFQKKVLSSSVYFHSKLIQ